MISLAEVACGAGFAFDWNALSAVATAAAVGVALWLPARDRRERALERLESEATSADIVAQKLAGLIEILPDVIAGITNAQGNLIDNPGSEVVYGITACKAVIDREAFCHQLPIAYVGRAELVCAIARMWCDHVGVRINSQRDPALKATVRWNDDNFANSLGKRLQEEAIQLHRNCLSTQARYARANTTIWQRLRKSGPGTPQSQ